jgi:hypothetical protein
MLSGPITAAVIHTGPDGQVGPRVVQICGHRGLSASGTTVLSAAQVADIVRRNAYLNVGTAENPHGEIRGALMAIPGATSTIGSGGSIGGHYSHVSHVSHASHVSHYSSG